MGSLAALSLGHASANGEVFKCVDASGKTSYQGDPCQTAAEAALKVQAPVPPEAVTVADPVLPPKHRTFLTTPGLTVMPADGATVADVTNVHPCESVIVIL